MDHFQTIYALKAHEYHRMIATEDLDGNLLPALEIFGSLQGKRILDLGSGTGRIPILLASSGVELVGLDLNRPMLYEQKKQATSIGGDWPLIHGDMRFLPFPDHETDVVFAGWAIGHLTGWYERDWKAQIGKILAEMNRVVSEGGSLFILETMTTGSLTPAPPSKGLAEYYSWLENDWGFSRQVIRTDYQFETVESAVEATEFFFGPEMAVLIRKNGWARLPEWTGVWSKQKSVISN